MSDRVFIDELQDFPVPGEWAPFSARYGVHKQDCTWGHGCEPWWSRHVDSPYTRVGDERDKKLRCACPGSSKRPGCRLRATQEDRLCDQCREYCLAIDESKVYHRLIDIYGAAQ